METSFRFTESMIGQCIEDRPIIYLDAVSGLQIFAQICISLNIIIKNCLVLLLFFPFFFFFFFNLTQCTFGNE